MTPTVVVAVLLLSPAAFSQQPPPPPGAYDAAPYLGQVRNTYVYGDIWERPGLSHRDRSMITVAVNQATYATNELRLHMGRALDNGITQAEISEIIAHTLWYSGFPTGVNAARVAAEVFAERGLPASPPGASSRQPALNPEMEFPGAFPQTPYLRDLLNQVVYAETWKRTELSRSRRASNPELHFLFLWVRAHRSSSLRACPRRCSFFHVRARRSSFLLSRACRTRLC